MFKAIRKAAYKQACKAFGYRVLVLGGACHGQRHQALTYTEAMAWVTCYGPNVRRAVQVRTWFGMLVAQVAVA